MLRRLPERAGGLENLAAIGASMVAAVLAHANLLRSEVISSDALVHLFWMWHFRDPELFDDALTADLRESSRYPVGYQALFWLPTQFVDPVPLGEWVGLAAMAASGWLVFRIVREQASWRPAPWIAAGAFLALVDIHRFFGGFPRAFVQPLVLLTVLLAFRRRELAAALLAGGGALIYPPGSLLAVGVLIVSALRWSDRRPSLDRRRASFGLLALAVMFAAVLVPQLFTGGAPRVFTADQARMFPEFGPRGRLHFFESSTVVYLRQNRSGLDLEAPGSILALAALALLLVRPRNLRLLRPEVVAIPVVALAAFGVAQAVLFRLYLPHRYTYPLVAFFAIAVGVAIEPTWKALWARPWPRLRAFVFLCAAPAVAAVAVHAFPLGPDEPSTHRTVAIGAVTVVAAAVAARFLVRSPAAGAALTGTTLLVVLALNSDHLIWKGTRCPGSPLTRYLATLPKDAVIAGDPDQLKCIPFTTRRPVVISTKLAPAYEVDYFLEARGRMFATLRARYGPARGAIVALRRRYGATHLWVRRGVRRLPRWGSPYRAFVGRLHRARQPAALRLPARCRTFTSGDDEVYDIGCISR